MAGTATGEASASAPLTTEIAFSGTAACGTTAAADLEVGPQGAALVGAVSCALTALGALTTQITLSGQATAACAVSAVLAGAVQLSVPITRVEIRGFKYL